MSLSHRVFRNGLMGFTAAVGLASAMSLASAQGGPPTELMPSPQSPAPAAGPQAPAAGPKTPLPAATPRAALPNQARQQANSDWPCIQPRIAELSYGQLWSGPALDDALEKWRSDAEVSDLVSLLVARRTSKEEADAALNTFAKAAGADKNARLTMVFAGVFQEINVERAAVLNGIERYARKQRALSDKIKDESIQLAAEKKGKDMAAQNAPEFRAKEEALTWDTRIYDERSHSLNFVCESPVILDQLAFDRARDIQSRMN